MSVAEMQLNDKIFFTVKQCVFTFTERIFLCTELTIPIADRIIEIFWRGCRRLNKYFC